MQFKHCIQNFLLDLFQPCHHLLSNSLWLSICYQVQYDCLRSDNVSFIEDLELPSCEPPLCCHVDHNREGLEPPTTGTRKQVLVSACGQTRACMRRSKHNLKCLRFFCKRFSKSHTQSFWQSTFYIANSNSPFQL